MFLVHFIDQIHIVPLWVFPQVKDYIEPTRRATKVSPMIVTQWINRLSKILKGLDCKINLIPFNPVDGCDYERSKEKNINAFQKYLSQIGFISTVRTTRGDDIDGACGQLIGNLNKAAHGKKAIERQISA